MVGGAWQRVHLGEMTTGQITMIPTELAGELFQITEKLKGQGIKHPAKIKEHEDYQDALKRYGFSHDWKAYQATYDLANKIKAITAVTSSDRKQVQKLFREELRADLIKHVKADAKKLEDKMNDHNLAELVDLGIMTEDQIKHNFRSGAYWSSIIDGTTMAKWHQLAPVIFPVVS